jgi:hypothetical protein
VARWLVPYPSKGLISSVWLPVWLPRIPWTLRVSFSLASWVLGLARA